MTKTLVFPYSESAVRALRAGDAVSLSGRIVTGRDRFHKFLADGGTPPVELTEGALYHCGPVMRREADGAWSVVAAGPTTSMREEPYEADVIERCSLRMIIGKGGMGPRTLAACRKFGCVYLQAVGGAAAILANAIKRVEGVYRLDEFGMAEAQWIFEVSGFEAIVGMDANGESLYEKVKADSENKLIKLLSH